MNKTRIATAAAKEITDRFEDESAIETANFDLCEFILAAARLAVADPELARRIGEAMKAGDE